LDCEAPLLGDDAFEADFEDELDAFEDELSEPDAGKVCKALASDAIPVPMTDGWFWTAAAAAGALELERESG